jgi:predicted phosphodiesterase
MTSAPGRACPPHYGYSPQVFARAPDVDTDTLYVIGGLYGNRFALDRIDRMAALEASPPRAVFNGDFHWFDAEAGLFAEVQRRVLAHVALRGNVETEIAGDDDAAGCGCAYPESVPDDDVMRSNRILERLRGVAGQVAGARTELAALPMHALAQVGGLRIGIVHGDAWSLAGWRFAHDSLHDAANDARLRSAFERAAVDGFACSHTCAPALRTVDGRFVVNNGAAGMANFDGDGSGLLTRISVRPLPAALARVRAYGLYERGVWIDALRIDFDLQAFLAQFDALWPNGSPAAVSYRHRIAAGPRFSIDHALGRTAFACAA